jgi:orotate phosphoribosyltransferase
MLDEAGGKVIGATSLVDRPCGPAVLELSYTPLTRIDVQTYSKDALPPDLPANPAVKPGSRAAA